MNKNSTRLILAGSALLSLFALARYRSALLGLIPRFLKDSTKASWPYRAGVAAYNRLQIARLAAKENLFLPPPNPTQAAQIMRDWEQAGQPLPGPGVFKRSVLRLYGEEFGLTTLVETGTFTGDTPAALKDAFQRIYSVELNSELVRRVKERLRDEAHITILPGDSETRLPEILEQISEPALFWLDSHYSGGITSLGSKVTPILGELAVILSHPVEGHVVLIDDARDFRHDKGHPTLDELQAFVADRRPVLQFEVRDDIIRMVPRSQ